MNNSTRSLRDIAQLASDRLGGVRGRALDREAKKLGLTLSYTTVDKILAGTYTSRPTRPTLDALAELSGVEPAEVYAAAGAALPMKPLADQLPPDVDTLTSEQRRIVIDLARVFVKQNQHERELQQRLGSGSNEDQDKPQADPPGKRTLRAIGPSGEAGQGQKIDPGWAAVEADSIFRENEAYVAANLGNITGASLLEHAGAEAIERAASENQERVEPVRRALAKALQFRIQKYLDERSVVPDKELLAAHPYFKTHREKFDEVHGERGEENQDQGE